MNEYLEQQRGRDIHGDSDWLHGLSEEHDRELAREERAFDCQPDPKPLRRATRAQARGTLSARETFKRAVADRDQGCCVHSNPSECEPPWPVHHVVPQQVLRKERPEALWNPLAGMLVCGLAHRQHHNRVRPITLREVPEDVEAFLRQSGFGWYLDRHYALPQRPVEL